MKQQVTPKISNVYRAFKEYAENAQLPIDSLLEDLRRYARFYEKLLTCKSGLKTRNLTIVSMADRDLSPRSSCPNPDLNSCFSLSFPKFKEPS